MEKTLGNTVGIVGGGASGMAAAITAARQGAQVTLLEGNDRLGKKILATGNGRCNLGNERLGLGEYYTCRPDLLERCLERFGTEEAISFFQGIGLMIKSKNGYLYPACEQAAAVLDMLRYEVEALGVRVITECKVEWVKKEQSTGAIRVRGNGKEFLFDRVILACGGQAAPKTGSDGSGYRLGQQLGHSIVPVVPALVQLRCREDYFKAVAGVRADAELKVLHNGECAAKERGELQLTDYGISGIPVFQLSRVVNYILLQEADAGEKKCSRKKGQSVRVSNQEDNFLGSCHRQESKEVGIVIDLLPDYTQEAFEQLIAGRNLLQGQRTVEQFFTGMLHKKLMLLFIKQAGLSPIESVAEADKTKLHRVYELCKNWMVHVIGSNSYENAQVCAGGIPLDEVTEDMESKKVSGVYFAGEILDVDGKCGGYNLQWAWCSGYLAGQAAAERRI